MRRDDPYAHYYAEVEAQQRYERYRRWSPTMGIYQTLRWGILILFLLPFLYFAGCWIMYALFMSSKIKEPPPPVVNVQPIHEIYDSP